MTALFCILTLLLAAYSLGHYLCAFLFLTHKRVPGEVTGAAESELSPVTVLIPAKNEGAAAEYAIRSVLDQNYKERIDVILLVKDEADTSVCLLKEAFSAEAPEPKLLNQEGDVRLLRLVETKTRNVLIAFVGQHKKSTKINRTLPHVATDVVALLDCDHRAEPEWLRSSVPVLNQGPERMVQCRRSPIFARGFFRLWDSLHQHIGCELFNLAFSRLGLTVFFTGTTAVMKKEVLAEFPLGPSITEDVDLSYRLLAHGEKIVSLPHHGSAEEVSPDLYSFLARRRRWASGHTEAFVRHLGKFLFAPLSVLDRVQFLFHGVHYLIALVVFALQLQIALFFAANLSPITNLTAALAGLLLTFLVVRTQKTNRWFGRLAETVVTFLWLTPAALIAMNFSVAVVLQDPGRAVLPLPPWVQAVAIVGILSPLIIVLIGLFGFRQLSARTFFVTVISYPVAFYLDVCGVLLGMTDLVTGQQRWRAVARAAQAGREKNETPEHPPLGIKDSWNAPAPDHSSGRPSRKLAWLTALLALFSLGAFHAFSTRISVANRECVARDFDDYPWVEGIDKESSYCAPAGPELERWSDPNAGTFRKRLQEDFHAENTASFSSLDNTFPCNEAHFRPDNVRYGADGLTLELRDEAHGGRRTTSGSIATHDQPEERFLYGRFETVMKPARASGVISAFFLYRFDPWQEIDAEFLGNDTTKLLLNVYYNPGDEGELYNYGYTGTPVVVDLGFDAADDFHRYAIEWDPEEIRWFVDDRLVHSRLSGAPTPIPHLPMRFFVNLWASCSESLAGPFTGDELPVRAHVRSLTIENWKPSPFSELSRTLGSLFSAEAKSRSPRPSDWREGATWVSPER